MTAAVRKATAALLSVVALLVLALAISASLTGAAQEGAETARDGPGRADESTVTAQEGVAPPGDGVPPGRWGDRRESSDAGAGRGGEQVFLSACASCHGNSGEGRIGPRLAGNRNLARGDYLLTIVLRGGDGMPAFADRLSGDEITAVASHLRTSWGNDFGPIDREALARQWWPQGAADHSELFARACARCHGLDGGGDFGPTLAGNENLADAQYVTGKILHGGGGMPAFEGIVAPIDVAALAGFVRTSFGNDFGDVDGQLALDLLSSPPGSGSGVLRLLLQPEGATLSILGPNGFVRFHSEGAPPVLRELWSGEYTVLAAAEGFESAEVVAPVQTGSTTTLRLTLPPVADEEGQRAEGAAEAPPPAERLGIAEIAITRPGSEDGDDEDAFRRDERADGAEFPAGDPTGGGDAQDFARRQYQSSCALCHGPGGRGGVGPPLAGNGNLQDTAFLLSTVITGRGAMPAFGHRLTDEQIAAIATHERNSWGNEFGEVEPAEVSEQRTEEPPGERLAEAGAAEGRADGAPRAEVDGAGSEVDGAGPGAAARGEPVTALPHGGRAEAARAAEPEAGSGGEIYYSYCSACHGSGSGLAAPGFRGNARLTDTSYVLSRIVMGGGGMPPFDGVLSTAQMAEVATYIRTSWGNDFGPVPLAVAQNYHGGASSLER